MPETQEQQPTTPVAQGAAPGTFPEGGLWAWATVVGAFVVQFSSFGYWSAFGVFQDYYTRIYLTHSPPSSISWIGSIGTFIVVSGGLVSGRLYDRGYFYFLLYGGSLLFCFSIFMLSLCRPEQYYQVFLAQGLGSGIGAATLYVPTIAVVSQYFQKRRALAMSIVASGSALGAVVFPILLNNTLNSHLGFASAVRITGGVITALLLGACPLLKPRIPPASNHPPFISSIRRFSKDLPYVLATAGTGLFTIGLYYPIFYLQLDAFTHGIAKNLAFYSLVIMNGLSFLGRLFAGFFAQKLGILNLMILATSCCGILILCMIALKNIASLIAIAILYGFWSGIYVTLLSPLIAMLTSNLSELGLRIGVSFFVSGVATLIGPPINGALLGKNFRWWRPSLFSGIVALAGSFFLLLTARALARKKKNAMPA